MFPQKSSITKILCLCIVVLAASVWAGTYSGGNGSEEEPFLISTAADMNEIGTHPEDFNDHFLLINDINMAEYTGNSFNIIGPNSTTPFTGVFDGNDHTIANFTYQSASSNYIGIFGLVSDPNAVIKDLTLIDPNVNDGTGIGVGSLIGFMDAGTIVGCCIDGATILGDTAVGGLVGFNSYGTIENCYVVAKVSGSNFTGGLVGWNHLGTIEDCYVSSIVFGGGPGGLAGLNTSTIKNCCSDGEITGKQVVGGLVGRNATNDDGGIGRLENCYSTANVTATTMLAGGLVAINEAIVKNCYATGNIDGNSLTGGLAGVNYVATLENCYAIGSVEGKSEVGGLVGKTRESTIKYCYAAGEVLGDVNIGGLVGSTYDSNNGFYTKCFWDTDVNPDMNGIGNAVDPDVIGKTTTEMMTESTFTDAGWDFEDVWRVWENNAYPKLRWQLTAGDFVWPDGVEINDIAVLADEWLLEKLSSDVFPEGGDRVVDFSDWAVFANAWSESGDMAEVGEFTGQWLQFGAGVADIAPEPDGDGVVNFRDFAVIAQKWMAGF